MNSIYYLIVEWNLIRIGVLVLGIIWNFIYIL